MICPVSPHLLNQEFSVSAPDQAWCGDITYIATDEGWLYLAGLKDLYSGEIVGYAMSERMTKDLEMQALFRAVSSRRPKPGLIQHTDRGSQYCARAYQKLVRQFGMRASMSRRGNRYDNAPIESFWGSLKSELMAALRYARASHTHHQRVHRNVLQPAAHAGPSRLPVACRITQRFYLDRTAA
jgi:putative transposase